MIALTSLFLVLFDIQMEAGKLAGVQSAWLCLTDSIGRASSQAAGHAGDHCRYPGGCSAVVRDISEPGEHDGDISAGGRHAGDHCT